MDGIFHLLVNFVNEDVLIINEIKDNIVNCTFSQMDHHNKSVPFKTISSQKFQNQTDCEMWNLICLLPVTLTFQLVMKPRPVLSILFNLWNAYVPIHLLMQTLLNLSSPSVA